MQVQAGWSSEAQYRASQNSTEQRHNVAISHKASQRRRLGDLELLVALGVYLGDMLSVAEVALQGADLFFALLQRCLQLLDLEGTRKNDRVTINTSETCARKHV